MQQYVWLVWSWRHKPGEPSKRKLCGVSLDHSSGIEFAQQIQSLWDKSELHVEVECLAVLDDISAEVVKEYAA